MNNKRSSSQTRDTILSAAALIVLKQGATRMTLDAVAKEAGVSKGGLLYHFPSKDALTQGMVERMNQEFTERIRDAYEKDDFGTNQGRWLRALIRATFTSTHLELGAGLMAAILHNPEFLDPVRRSYEIRQTILEQDGIDLVTTTIIRLVVDGLWFSELLGLAPPKEPLRLQLMETLLSLTTGNRDMQTDRDGER